MELTSIEKLLVKYNNGNTSLQEESDLRDYFTGEFVAPHLQEYVSVFTYFTAVKNDTYNKNILLKPKKFNNIRRKFMSVAASIVLLLSATFVAKQEYDRFQAHKKLAQITKGLKLLSNQLKKGEVALANVYSYKTTPKLKN